MSFREDPLRRAKKCFAFWDVNGTQQSSPIIDVAKKHFMDVLQAAEVIRRGEKMKSADCDFRELSLCFLKLLFAMDVEQITQNISAGVTIRVLPNPVLVHH